MYFLLHLAISGEANLLAIALPGRYTSLLASGILIVLWSSGGVAPPTLIFRDRMGGLGKFLNAVSPFSASFRLQFFIEVGSAHIIQYQYIICVLLKVYEVRPCLGRSHRKILQRVPLLPQAAAVGVRDSLRSLARLQLCCLSHIAA